jgi:transposase
MRNLRDLTRYRSKLVGVMASEKNRIIKILETANIKLSSVLSDVFGESGRRIIEDLAKGVTDPKELVQHIVGRVKHSKDDFIRALTGRITKHHSFLIQQALDHICDIGNIVEKIEKEIDAIAVQHVRDFELLKTVPGISTGVWTNFAPKRRKVSPKWAGFRWPLTSHRSWAIFRPSATYA